MTTIANVRSHTSPAFAGSLAVLAMLVAAPLARAQQPESLPSTPITDQRPPPLVAAPLPAVAPAAPSWALISGYEGDTHGSGYGFFGPSYVHPIRPGLSWTARASGSFLTYQFRELDGITRVRSPGLSSAIGLQFGDKRFVRVFAGPEVKWRRTEMTDASGLVSTRSNTRVGANVGGELYADPTTHNNVQGLINYNTSDRYSWGRLGFKEQISNRTWEGPNAAFVGVEGIAQGNRDIRSKQVGGFFELTHIPAKVSIMFKAGYKRSTFDVGPDKTGPYFSVGFYRRLK